MITANSKIIKNREADAINPLVSVIVLAYNSSKYVLETLESIKAQTYKNIELIISDDGSKDDTIQICENWLKENTRFFINSKIIAPKENSGIPANCNRGIHASKGEWIKFIAGDDCLMDYCVAEFVEIVTLNKEIFFLHAETKNYVNIFEEHYAEPIENKSHYRFNSQNITPSEQFQILLRINPIAAPTTFINKKILLMYGGFDEEFKLWEDRPMWIKLTQNNVKLHYANRIMTKYRVTDGSVQFKNPNKKLFTAFELQRDFYMMHYNSYLPFFERFIKNTNYNRRFLMDRTGLNKNNLFSRIINKIFGHFLLLIIKRYDHKYL